MALAHWPAGPAPYAFENDWGYAHDPEVSTLGRSDYSRRVERDHKEATGGITFRWAPAYLSAAPMRDGERRDLERLAYLAAAPAAVLSPAPAQGGAE